VGRTRGAYQGEEPVDSEGFLPLHRWWNALLERAGVEDHTMHEARHAAITQIVRDTGNLKLAQLLAGHASIQTTADI